MSAQKKKALTLEEEVNYLRKRNKQLEKLVITDPLTGVYNHRYFKKRLSQEVARSERYSVNTSLLMIDVDDFKKCNDAYGHVEGDCLLIEIAKILKKHSRKMDIVCRYGGDEFSIILPETKLCDARVYAKNIQKEVNQLELKCTPSISVGVADIQEQESMLELINDADESLYYSKKKRKKKD